MPRSASVASDSTVTAYVKSTRPSSANRNNRYYQSQSQQPLVQVDMNDGGQSLEKKRNEDQTRNNSSVTPVARVNIPSSGKLDNSANGEGTNGTVPNGFQSAKKNNSTFIEITSTPPTTLQTSRRHNCYNSYVYGAGTSYDDVKNGKPAIIFQQPQPTTSSWSRYGSELLPESCLYTCRHCDNEIVTATSSQRGLCVWLSACALCFLGCCCFSWVPFVVRYFRDIDHYCPKCGHLLGTYERFMSKTRLA